MLSELRIQGLGVIEDATLDLHPGLTAVTGETGAGKTMVVTGLHLLGGGRGDSSRVRRGADRALVEGRFVVPRQQAEGGPEAGGGPADEGERGDGGPRSALEVARDAGAALDDDGSLIAARTVSADGRSRAHLGGRSVPLGVLGDVADASLAVHGQHEALRLLRATEQRAVLDRFAGAAAAGPLAAYRRTRGQWRAAVAALEERRGRTRELAREADLLRHGLAEIEALDPRPGEDAALVEEARRLADIDDLRGAATEALTAAAGAPDGDADEPDVVGLLGQARRALAGAAGSDPRLAALEPRLAEAAALVADAAAELTGYLEDLAADPDRLHTVLERQAVLKGLTRKYAADVDGVLDWAATARERLAGLDVSDEAIAALAADADRLATELAGHAAALTAARTAAAARLSTAVTDELDGLAMAAASVQVVVSPKEAPAAPAKEAPAAPAKEGARKGASSTETSASGGEALLEVGGRRVPAGPYGVDDVEFLLAAHAGAPPLPIARAASGGELSRVMLAVEVVLADADPVPTLVFDEVDAGVGGHAAVEIGRRLARLAVTHQVVVVTHLAQVAAYADRQLMVDKSADGDAVTRSAVRTLDAGERVVELARMLAGETSETGRAHAEELLAAAAHDRELDRATPVPPTPITRAADSGRRRRTGGRRAG